MKHLTLIAAALFTFSLFTLSASAAVPLKWTVETSRATPATFDAYQGETLALEAALQSYGKPLEEGLECLGSLEGLAANLYWQTNGMGSAYWTAPAAVRKNSNSQIILCATWSPTNEVGAKVYNCFIALQNLPNLPNLQNLPNLNYHAAFQLRLRPSPGATPNELPLPQKVIDFAKVTVLNPPWESGGGIDTNAVERIANRAIETNAVTVGLASSVSDLQSSKLDKSDVVPPTPDAGEGQAADAMATYEALEDVRLGASTAQSVANEAMNVAVIAVQSARDAMDLADQNAGEIGNLIQGKIDKAFPPDPEKTYLAALTLEGGIASSGVTTADIAGKADKEDLEPLSEDIRAAYQYARTVSLYMTGNTNAWFAGTNYVLGADAEARTHFAWEDGMDATTVPCSMSLWELRDGVKQSVWDQRDWTVWYWSFKAQQMRGEIDATNRLLYAAITNDENHAWAGHYAATGRRNPDASTTFIDTPSVTLSPGMSWETVATVGGCGYWTIVGNGAVIGGSGTNATLNVKDFEGNSILEITKGQHMLAWLESGDFVGNMVDADRWICFDMMADVKPTGYFSTTLVASDFVAETDADCPAQYRWEDLGGHVWRVHFLLKPGIVSDACFAKFMVEVEGRTQIRYNADTVINGGLIFDGVKIAPVIQAGAAVGSTVTWKVVQ